MKKNRSIEKCILLLKDRKGQNQHFSIQRRANKLTKDISGGSCIMITIYRIKPSVLFFLYKEKRVHRSVKTNKFLHFLFAVAEWGRGLGCKMHSPCKL
jgi:hypothetical protein